jgi:hypothetical protein
LSCGAHLSFYFKVFLWFGVAVDHRGAGVVIIAAVLRNWRLGHSPFWLDDLAAGVAGARRFSPYREQDSLRGGCWARFSWPSRCSGLMFAGRPAPIPRVVAVPGVA